MQRLIFAITGSPGTGKTTLSNQLPIERFDRFTVEQIATELGCIEDQDGDIVVTPDLLSDWKYKGDKIAIIEGHLAHYCNVDAVILLRCHPDELNIRLSSREGYDATKIQNNIEWEMIAGIWPELIERHPYLPILELDMTNTLHGKDSVELFMSQYKSEKTVRESIPLAIDWLSDHNLSESI
jgi:adenylate kinase